MCSQLSSNAVRGLAFVKAKPCSLLLKTPRSSRASGAPSDEGGASCFPGFLTRWVQPLQKQLHTRAAPAAGSCTDFRCCCSGYLEWNVQNEKCEVPCVYLPLSLHPGNRNKPFQPSPVQEPPSSKAGLVIFFERSSADLPRGQIQESSRLRIRHPQERTEAKQLVSAGLAPTLCRRTPSSLARRPGKRPRA